MKKKKENEKKKKEKEKVLVPWSHLYWLEIYPGKSSKTIWHIKMLTKL